MSKAVERIAARIEDLPEGSLRRRVLEGARRFKSSWVEMARLLSQVRRQETWREWGFATFERYCQAELFLRKQTVDKLTASYGFLERHEPELARAREPRGAPPFEVIEVLSRAEAAGRLPDGGWESLREEVVERGATPAAVSRRLAERWGGPPPQPAPPAAERLSRLAAAARRLADACREEARLPEALRRRAEALAEELAALAGE
ncbi:MAG TPA: hypothetical protein VFR85_13215 [Anaeromyxobacteraceae bacterium]|nr:hypothetical protein [Anaeromyxobacteraceae bacterium]